jgi:hypothetical protein
MTLRPLAVAWAILRQLKRIAAAQEQLVEIERVRLDREFPPLGEPPARRPMEISQMSDAEVKLRREKRRAEYEAGMRGRP